MSKPRKIKLIIEKQNGKLWGRVLIKENLLFDSATSLPLLEKKLLRVVRDFEGWENVQFEYAYDLTVFFEQFNFLNQTRLAELAGLHPGLIRQYSSGHKQPSKEQVRKIEKAIQVMGSKLRSVRLASKAQVSNSFSR